LDEVHRVVARKLLLRPGDMLVAPVGEADLHPLFEKRARHAEADAAGPAGDEGDLAGQMFHACSSRARPWARPYSMKMGAITTLRRPLRAFRSPCAGAAVHRGRGRGRARGRSPPGRTPGSRGSARAPDA